jgi:tetratricopeptide (TPR) repeat protein
MKVNKKQEIVEQHPEITVELPLTQQKAWFKKEWAYFALLFFVISIVWSTLSNYTWDDDAVARFMNVGAADTHPYNFLDSWNRPLFTTLFYLPIKFFGRMGMVVLMSLLTTISGCLLYKAMEIKGEKRASIIVIFLVFQTFLFGISRDAMTEPLASFIFSLGIYFYYKKNYTWFALIGSLLPLARTETILLMPFWALILIQAKKYKHILLLGVGMALWSIGLFMYSGNFFEIFKELLKTGDKKNRYDRMAVGHHFLKYVYVVGPIIFYFGVLGFFTSLKRILKEPFIIAHFLVGFLLYVLFSSVMDLGQSGGALRNLVTISPLAAILCFYGFRFWTDTIEIKQAPKQLVATPTKKNNQQNVVEEKSSNVGIRKTVIIVYTLVFLLFAWQLFTNKLMLRQIYDEFEKDYTVFLYLLAGGLIIIFSLINVFKKVLSFFIYLLLALQIAFVLNFESPDSHGNAERVVMNKVFTLINNSPLKNEKIISNHGWYYWVSGINSFDSSKSMGLDSASSRKAKPGNVIVWDAHYNNKNYSNLQVPYLLQDTTLTPLIDILDSTNGFSSIIFLKQYLDQDKNDNVFKELIAKNEDNGKLHYYYGNYLMLKKRDYSNALVHLNKALQLDRRLYFAYYLRGVCYLNTNQLQLACNDLTIAVKAGVPEAKPVLANSCK